MRKLASLLVLVLLVGGWLLASAALHVVRTPGDIPYLGGVEVLPKERLTLQRTFFDTTHWTPADLDANADLVARLTDAGKEHAFEHVFQVQVEAPADPTVDEPAAPQRPEFFGIPIG